MNKISSRTSSNVSKLDKQCCLLSLMCKIILFNPIQRLFFTIAEYFQSKKKAFSLVEMLMALLVASLLLAALAPVITKKFGDSMTISVEGEIPGKKTKTHQITYQDCLDNGGIEKQERDGNGNIISEYCEGVFEVPAGYNGSMKVTVIGAGGGGGVASTAGHVEYTIAGSTNNFKVPAIVNKIEATLISAGAGGGAGGQTIINHTFVASGNGNVAQNSTNLLTIVPEGFVNWPIPDVVKNKYALFTACGGGGGGGGASGTSKGGGGGSGGYYVNRYTRLPESGSMSIRLGGGGGGGAADNQKGNNGHWKDGGGGGSSINYITSSGANIGSLGGHCIDDKDGYGGKSYDGRAGEDGVNHTNDGMVLGGAGYGGGGKGGNAYPNYGSYTAGAGGGGGIYQGGGGGGASGGSGGGGGASTFIGTSSVINDAYLNAAGGGGGGGAGYSSGRGGGGGGGAGYSTSAGGIGGNGAAGGGDNDASSGGGGSGGNPGSGASGGEISTIFGNNYCSGGSGGENSGVNGKDGKDGALRISYLSYGTGGSGGGSGKVYALNPISVVEDETLKVVIGEGGIGGTAGYINNSGAIINPVEPECPINVGATYILRGSSFVLGDNKGFCSAGGWPGRSTGIACNASGPYYYSEGGSIYYVLNAGLVRSYPVDGGMSANTHPSGFFSTNGHPAGDSANLNCGANAIANGTTGGSGGTVTTPFTGTCTPGKGGTRAGEAGGNAQGYGCGGGGGYGLSNGGHGGGGYARLSWNKYWDANMDNGNGGYKYATAGAGGGGASGNIMIYTVQNLKSGEKVKIKIGKGGTGAYINNNRVINARKGGDTIFAYDTNSKKVSAGGGNGGNNPVADNSIANNPVVNNGSGGNISSVCSASSGGTVKDYFNTICLNNRQENCCIKGVKGSDGQTNEQGARGGNGADLTQSSMANKGGGGGISGTGAQGKTPSSTSIGSGGGGAGILDVGTPSVTTSSDNKGGNGANGKIILEWWE